MLFRVPYMHMFCIFVLKLVQRDWACFIWKRTLEIQLLSLLSLLLLLLSSLLLESNKLCTFFKWLWTTGSPWTLPTNGIIYIYFRPCDTLPCCWVVKQTSNQHTIHFYRASGPDASDTLTCSMSIHATLPVPFNSLYPIPHHPTSAVQVWAVTCALLTVLRLNSFRGIVVCWLLNVPATCKCISGTDLLRQFYVLPHWDRSCRPNSPSHPVIVYWHQANKSQH